MLNALDFPEGSQERLMLLAPQRFLARDDQRDTICTGTNLRAQAVGWKPEILKQIGAPATITFFFPTLVNNGAAGGGPAFTAAFVIRGVASNGAYHEERFRVSAESKLGTSVPEAFTCYTSRTTWRWVLEIEMLAHETNGSGTDVDGFYCGHAIGGLIGSLYYDHDGMTFDVGKGRGPIDAVIAWDRNANTVTRLSSSQWSYNPRSGRLNVTYGPNASWDTTADLYLIDHPEGRR